MGEVIRWVVIIGGILGTLMCLVELIKLGRATRSWPRVSAVAVSVQRRDNLDSHGRRYQLYAPLVRFQTLEGQVVEAIPDSWASHSIAESGDHIQVRYNPARVDQVNPTGFRNSGAGGYVIVVLVAPIVIALLWIYG